MVNPDLVAATPREHGDQTAANIDKEVDRLIQEGLALATAILQEQRDIIDSLANRLLTEQQLTGTEIRRTLGLPEREPLSESKDLVLLEEASDKAQEDDNPAKPELESKS
jgi:hypothetical protein